MPPLNYAVRITLPYSDVSGTVHVWALKCDKLVVYQHVGSETEKVHVHLLLMSSSVSAERLKQLSGLIGSGNEFWSFKTKSKKTGPLTDKTSGQYITYMTKGKYDPMYVKGYDSKVLVALKEAWVQRDEVAHPGRVLLAEFREYLYGQQDQSIMMTRMHIGGEEDGEEYEL